MTFVAYDDVAEKEEDGKLKNTVQKKRCYDHRCGSAMLKDDITDVTVISAKGVPKLNNVM